MIIIEVDTKNLRSAKPWCIKFPKGILHQRRRYKNTYRLPRPALRFISNVIEEDVEGPGEESGKNCNYVNSPAKLLKKKPALVDNISVEG